MLAAEVVKLRVETIGRRDEIVDDISFTLRPGEIVGLVGESGSGKSTVALSLLAYARRGATIASGRVIIDGKDILSMHRNSLQGIRGRLVAYIPQDPAAAINPFLSIGTQLREVLAAHRDKLTGSERNELVGTAMRDVQLPGDAAFLSRLPHQLSGGQLQRVAIAMAFMCQPKLIVLDEPTTGLDVSTQAYVLRTVARLCQQSNAAALYVTHDLAVVSSLADRILVMYGGRIVEAGRCEDVFTRPRHPYTRKLLRATPDRHARYALETMPGRAPRPGSRDPGCRFAPRCAQAQERCHLEEPSLDLVAEAHQTRCFFPTENLHQARVTALIGPEVNGTELLNVSGLSASYGNMRVLDGVSFSVREGECVALLGGSGSGKTTLARCIMGLVAASDGTVRFAGQVQARDARGRPASVRQQLQYIFQSPFRSLNPRRTIGDIVASPLETLFNIRGARARQEVLTALERVSLTPAVLGQYPGELSGGERQRVAIARALVCRPKLLICDEITSALDVSVQANVVDLLRRLQREDRLGLLFVTHDIALVRNIADSVLVINQGRVVESGRAADVIDRPSDGYTKFLVNATPSIEIPVPAHAGSGM
ncbi:ABC transporter ATP-binding protein [Mesorhizobium sp. M8A.F.Ca.ET.173.01.1.1]|nr:ABC transporter ATP-binding protein [Mesorhizobium sp. M8A.F.Ca.ET.173.01.1.1]